MTIWILLAVALILLCTGIAVVVRQAFLQKRSFSGPIMFGVRSIERPWLFVATKLPVQMFVASVWPAAALWLLLTYLRPGRPLNAMAAGEAAAEQHRLAGTIKTIHFPIFGLITFLPLLAVETYVVPLGMPFALWLWFAWLALLLWLMSSFIPGNSLSLWIRMEPDTRMLSTIGLLLLFVLLFPLTSSALTLNIQGKALTPEHLMSSLIGIFSLGGVLWEGPKLAIPKLLAQPGDALQLTTSLILYLSLGGQAISSMISPITDIELRVAAATQLALGFPSRAEAYIRLLKSDLEEDWNLRLVHAIMVGKEGFAIGVVETKLDPESVFSRNRAAATIAVLLPLSMEWRTSAECRARMWEYFVEAKPSEEDLLVIWLNASKLNADFVEYSDNRFLEFATQNDYYHFRFMVAMSRQNEAEIAELAQLAFSRCSLSYFVSQLTYIIQIIILIEKGESPSERVIGELVASFPEIRRRAMTVCQLAIGCMALNLLKAALGSTRQEAQQMLSLQALEMRDALQMMKGGPKYVASIEDLLR